MLVTSPAPKLFLHGVPLDIIIANQPRLGGPQDLAVAVAVAVALLNLYTCVGIGDPVRGLVVIACCVRPYLTRIVHSDVMVADDHIPCRVLVHSINAGSRIAIIRTAVHNVYGYPE